MFEAMKRKIVTFILLFLGLFLLLSMTVIYCVSYGNVYQENQTVLTNCADNYLRAMTTGRNGENETGAVGRGFMEALKERGLSLTMFYAVTLERDGTIRDVMNVPDSAYGEAEVVKAAEEILSRRGGRGAYRGWVWQRRETEEFKIAVWMDNTALSRDARTLLRNTLMIGGLIIILMLPLAVRVAESVVAPMEETEKRQRAFLSNAEHELKTPITTIGANAELLLREIGENRWLSSIRQENGRMAKMVGELLELSRVESAAPVRSMVRFSRLVLGGILPYETIAYDRGYALETDMEPDLTLLGDEGQLAKLIAILMDNAVSHSSGSGAIRVTLKREKARILLTVSNPGAEISPEVLPRLFDRFYRTETARPQDGHYGLGLSIARAIAEAHGGSVSAESKDHVTSFTAQFPV